VIFSRYLNDWTATLRLNLQKLIVRHDDDGSADADGDGVPDEVEEVGAVCYAYNVLYTCAFAYYAEAAYQNGDDLYLMPLNGWTQFTEDAGLVDKASKFCKRNDMDCIFMAVDAAAANDHKHQLSEMKRAPSPPKSPSAKAGLMLSQGSVKNRLSRYEFLAALVHVAIKKYIMSGELADVSEAVERLFRQIAATIGVSTLPVPDVFRSDGCYTPEVCAVLFHHLGSMRTLYSCLVELDPRKGLLTYRAWNAFIHASGLIGEDSSERESTLCFIWSVTAVVDGQTVAGKLKEENLPFEGFLEALCRMATVKVLPTDDEVSDNGCSDAGTYIRWLELNDRIALSRLQNERACEFGQWPDQPLHRCVDHLIHMIIRTIENTDESGGGSVVLSAAEFKLWAQDSGFAKRNWR